jgi:hypothetical protein
MSQLQATPPVGIPVAQPSSAAPAATPAAQGMTADSFFWYNPPGGSYGPLGLAVPNWGDNPVTQSSPLFNLALKVGKDLQAIMFRPDALLTQPPQVNTVLSMVNLTNRMRQVILGRTVPEGANERLLEPSRATPPTYTYLVFPTRFYNIPNLWMSEYCEYMLLCLEEIMQCEENGRPLEITQNTSQILLPYEARVQKLIAMELFQVPLPADPSQPDGTVINGVAVPNPADPNFSITPALMKAFPYKPNSGWYTPTPNVATPPAPSTVPSAATIKALSLGFPVSALAGLPQWPGSSGGASSAS